VIVAPRNSMTCPFLEAAAHNREETMASGKIEISNFIDFP
jgi:hypothetical protein